MNSLQKGLRTSLHFGELIAGIGVTAIGIAAIPATLVGLPVVMASLPVTYHGLMKTNESILDLNKNNSVFRISNSKLYAKLCTDNKLTIQQSLPTYKQIAQINSTKDKKDKSLFLREQLLNCLLSCPKEDKDGKPVDIHTTTHPQVINFFKHAEELGFIENLEITDAGSRSMTNSKILFGNFKNLFQKYDFSNLKFNSTRQPADMDSIKKLLRVDELDSTLYNFNLDEHGNIQNIDRKLFPFKSLQKLNSSKKQLLLDEPKEIKKDVKIENKLEYLKIDSKDLPATTPSTYEQVPLNQFSKEADKTNLSDR